MSADAHRWDEPLLDLIDSLYRANHPKAIGEKLFNGLNGLMPFDGAVFTPIDWHTLELLEGVCRGVSAPDGNYAEWGHAPFDILLFEPTRLNSTLRLSDAVPSRYFSDCEVDASNPRPGFCYALGVVASWRRQPVALIRFYRRGTAPDFSDNEIKLLNRLALHVANALYLQDATIALEPLREPGLIVYGVNDRLIYRNEAAGIMLQGIPLATVLQIARKGGVWLKNGNELYRTEMVSLMPNSLLALFAQSQQRKLFSTAETVDLTVDRAQTITIISVEPFRRRQAIANRLKHAGLSQREIDVSIGIMRGLSNANIAKQLFIDETTVKDHLHRIYAKIHIRTRTELISKMLGLDTELADHEAPVLTDITRRA